jgi:hypothetical protein
MAPPAQPVETFQVHSGKVDVAVYTSAPHVFAYLAKHAPATGQVVADIDNTVTTGSSRQPARPLGRAVVKHLSDHGLSTTFVTARHGKSGIGEREWGNTFFELYNIGLAPTVTAKKNSVVLFEPPPRYKSMSESRKDLLVEIFKQEQRALCKKGLFLTIGDCVWDGVGTHPENPQRLDLHELYKHRDFGKAYFIFGNPSKQLPKGAYATFFLLMPPDAHRRLLETPEIMAKTDTLVSSQAAAGGGRATTQKKRSKKTPHGTP